MSEARETTLTRAASIAGDLGAVLSAMPTSQARAVIRALAYAVDDVRRVEGYPLGVSNVLFTLEPFTPDYLKTRDDWVRDLKRAWRALSNDDRAAFLLAATKHREAA